MIAGIIAFIGGAVFTAVAISALAAVFVIRTPEPWDEPHDTGRP